MLEKKMKVILVGDAGEKKIFINKIRNSGLPPYGFMTNSLEFKNLDIWHLVATQYFEHVKKLHSDAKAIIYIDPLDCTKRQFEQNRDPAVTLAFDYRKTKLSPRELLEKIIFLLKPGVIAKEKQQHYTEDMKKNSLLFRAQASPESILHALPKEVIGLIANQYLQLNAVTRCSFFAYPIPPVEQKKEEVAKKYYHQFSKLPL